MGDGPDTRDRVRGRFEKILEPGQLAFDPEAPGDPLFVIQWGAVEVLAEGDDGLRCVAQLGSGDFFGAGLPPDCPGARAVATARSAVLELDAPTLKSLCVEQPDIAIRMIRELVARLIGTEQRLRALDADDLRRSVVRTLVRCAEPPGEGGVRIPIDLRTLAEESGLSLLQAHRALHQLFDRHALELVDDCLLARDLDALAAGLETAG